MARREILIPVAAVALPGLPFTGLGPFPPTPGGFPGAPFGLPPLPPFMDTGAGYGGPINPQNFGSGSIGNNLFGGLLGNISPEGASTGGGKSGIGKINNIVIPTTTSTGVPFTIQFYFMNLTTAPMSFGGVLNIQGLGLDMTSIPTVNTMPGQAGVISQNMSIPVNYTSGVALPGTFQLIHYNANGAQVVDDEQAFTIPGPSSVAVAAVPTIVGSPSTDTPDTHDAAVMGALPTLPSVPGAGIVSMMSPSAMTPALNPNDPMHKRGDECSNLPMMLPDLPPMAMVTDMNGMMHVATDQDRMEHMRRQEHIRRRHRHCMERMRGKSWQGGMLVDGKWVPSMAMPPAMSTLMITDPATGMTTTTTTTTMAGPSAVMMNPIVNNNMDLGDLRDRFNPQRMGQLPINSPVNQVQGSWTPGAPGMAGGVGMPGMPGMISGPPPPPGPPMIPQLPPAMNMPPWWNNQWMPMMNQMWNPFNNQPFWQNGPGFSDQGFNDQWNMQRTGSFQWMPWMNPNTGQPGTIAVPMMQMQPQGFMVPGAMLAEDINALPTADMEESTPFNDELDVMLLGRNRDRERGIEVPMPMVSGCIDSIPCSDNDEWAVIHTVYEERTGTGSDVPTMVLGYNFCPGEQVKISWHVVLWGGYSVEGQVFRGEDMTQADHSGRCVYHLRLPDLPDAVQGDGLVKAHGITSMKRANCTISVA